MELCCLSVHVIDIVFWLRQHLNMTTEESTKAMEEVKIGDSAPGEQEDVVDPWNVKSSSDKGVDYDKLISKIFMFVTVLTHTHTRANPTTAMTKNLTVASIC